MTEPELYQKWLEYVFEQPNAEKRDYFLDNEDHRVDEERIVNLVSHTFLNAGRDLSIYSDLQLKNGLSYIFYNYESDVIYTICRDGVAEDKRVEAVRHMSALYRDCFATRCAPVLSHLDEAGSNPVNSICYMLWDVSPLCQWQDVVLEVLEAALYLPNPACVESALHGLNHRCHQSQAEVVAIVDRFLASAKALRPELRLYALQARSGRLQ